MEDKRRKGRFNNHVHLFKEDLYKLFVPFMFAPFMFAPFDKLLHLLCIFLEKNIEETRGGSRLLHITVRTVALLPTLEDVFIA